MATVSFKAGTSFSIPVKINDDNFALIDAIEFMFKQDEDDDEGAVLKTAYWSEATQNDCDKVVDGQGNVTFLIRFHRADTYLFDQNENFYMDTRIHYAGAEENPPTNIVRLRMTNTLFESGEEASANG